MHRYLTHTHTHNHYYGYVMCVCVCVKYLWLHGLHSMVASRDDYDSYYITYCDVIMALPLSHEIGSDIVAEIASVTLWYDLGGSMGD